MSKGCCEEYMPSRRAIIGALIATEQMRKLGLEEVGVVRDSSLVNNSYIQPLDRNTLRVAAR